MLTHCLDTDYQILYHLDLKSISRFCQTNSQMKKYCDSPFWIKKINIEYDFIFPYKFKNPHFQKLNEFVYQNIKIPTHFNDWLIFYDKLNTSEDNANYLLTIFDVEQQNKKSQILIQCPYYIMCLIVNTFSYECLYKNYKNDMDKLVLKIIYRDDTYYVYVYVNNQYRVYKSYHRIYVIDLLFCALYLQFKFNNVTICDENGMYFLHTHDDKRRGMLELLKYQRKNKK
jgi:hypothetical protein